MKRLINAILCVLGVYCAHCSFLVLAAQECTKEYIKEYTIDQFLQTETISTTAFGFHEKELYFTSDRDGIFNIYTLDFSTKQIDKLSASKNHAQVFVAALPPSPLGERRFLFTQDGLGDERSHIFLQEQEKVSDVTPFEGATCYFGGMSHDLKSFFFTANDRDKRFMDLYEVDCSTLQTKMIYENTSGLDIGDISRNKRYITLSKAINANSNILYLFDRETNTLEEISPYCDGVSCTSASFSPDSTALFVLTDKESEFTYLSRYDIAKKQFTEALVEPWDIVGCGFSYKGTYRTCAINQDSDVVIKVTNAVTGQLLAFPVMPTQTLSYVRFSRSENLALLGYDSDRCPTEYYLYYMNEGRMEKLLSPMNPEIDPADLVDAEVIRYPSFDGTMIPAIYYRPHGKKERDIKAKTPALIMVHGGPGGQAMKGYSFMKQFLVNQGYAILDVNNRGSSGYGKSFFKAADKKHGELDLEDCMAAKKFLISTGSVDPEKIGIIGGSYGGYMALAALTFRPQEMAVGIDICGVSNWLRTLESLPAWWETARDLLYKKIGNPTTERDYLTKISPLFHASNIVKPLLVIQGANDPRVLRSESDEIVAAVRKNNVPCCYVLFEDEGHGFEKKENKRILAKATIEFLREYMPCIQKK